MKLFSVPTMTLTGIIAVSVLSFVAANADVSAANSLVATPTESPAYNVKMPVYARYSSIADIIQREKQIAFFDGTSFYVLNADGTFNSFPGGISGRVITGTWKAAKGAVFTGGYAPGGSAFTIEGQWTLRGQMGGDEDYRRMTITLFPPSSYETMSRLGEINGKPNKIYSCPFTIDELVKVVKPDTAK